MEETTKQMYILSAIEKVHIPYENRGTERETGHTLLKRSRRRAALGESFASFSEHRPRPTPSANYILSSFLFSALVMTPRSNPLDAAFLCDGGVPGDTS